MQTDSSLERLFEFWIGYLAPILQNLLPMVRPLLLGILALCSTSALAAKTTADLKALEVYASNRNGDPSQTELGHEFFLSLRYEVVGSIAKGYAVKLSTPYQTMQTPYLNLGIGAPGSYRVTWGPFLMLTDHPFQASATLIGERGLTEITKLNNVASSTLFATKPVNAIEYFATKSIDGEFGLEVSWQRSPGTVEIWIPKLLSQTSQTVLNQTVPGDFEDDAAYFGFSNLTGSKSLFASSHYTIEASSQRVNSSLLKLISFESVHQSVPDQGRWLRPEVYVESDNSQIAEFARGAAAFAPDSSPYSVAEAIYSKVLSRCTYAAPKPTSKPSALRILRTSRGDCGALSSLFVASCRSMGISARTVAGFAKGTDQWHVWAEFFLPGAGWISVDPAYAKGRMPKGSLPIYFGVVPELNERVATAYGFDATVNGRTIGLLQASSVFWKDGRIKTTKSRAFASASIVGN